MGRGMSGGVEAPRRPLYFVLLLYFAPSELIRPKRNDNQLISYRNETPEKTAQSDPV